MKQAFIGIGIMIFAQLFCLAETVYFGNNWTPQSPPEKICDILALLLTLCGLWLVMRAPHE